MITVKTKKGIRKVELKQLEGGQEWLDKVSEVVDIQGNIMNLSYDNGSRYGVYLCGIPKVSPIDFTGIETDPLTGDLVSIKVNMLDGSAEAKIYHVGNIKNIEWDNPVTGTGLYVGSDKFTIYYPTDGDVPECDFSEMVRESTLAGFSATTFFEDGTISDESVYVYEELPNV